MSAAPATPGATAPLLRDLIRIPERVHQGDFVLKLAEGVSEAHAAATVAEYVVTPQLARAFDHALGFVARAVQGGGSGACYLHGSFGAGKSHFMAVLNLLLAGNKQARGILELAPLLNRHDPALLGKRFLMVPYHLIGAPSAEAAILGGYAEHVRRLHPDAPVPAFYLGESLFRDARALRRTMGDRAFFDGLDAGDADGADEGWGDLSSRWDAAAFDAAAQLPPTDPERQRLVGDLLRRYFSGYADVAQARGEAFVDLDAGLAILSGHAKSLGYDAVVLFLDELILWLASRAGELDWVSREGAKLSKLVEAQRTDRPAPVVSFVARQRDLRELVGDHQAGALNLRFADTLKYWEARFDQVVLEDRNLPVIAERRLLRPVSEGARQEMDAAFDTFASRRRDVLEVLLGTEGERDLFRKTYPFSPALVQALVAASSVLQRERTALKLMLSLLVERRDELRLGSLIPVGDLWDALSAGDAPFSEGMKIRFEDARKLWAQKLLPLLEGEHGITWQELQEGERGRDPRHDGGRATANLRNDARLLKTLLLAALVPEVEALRGLTPDRLAALNWGSVATPVAGAERQAVLNKLRRWTSRVGEIRISEDANPLVSLQITGVDVEPVLANAQQYDTEATRRTTARRLLLREFGIAGEGGLLEGQGAAPHRHRWRGTVREVDVHFEAVADLSDDRLRGRAGAPLLVLGMPFDARGRGPMDHRARLRDRAEEDGPGDGVGADGVGGVAWLPSYLSDRAMRDLGTLVRIEHLLAGAGDRLQQAAAHLSASDREQARALLASQRSALEERIRGCLRAAYGIQGDTDGCLGAAMPADERLVALDGAFQPRTPVGATLRDALSALLDSLFEQRYPAHPDFPVEAKPAALRRVLDAVQRAAEQPGQRLFIEERALRQELAGLAAPLHLGTMGQTHLVLSSHWATVFGRAQARAGASGPMPVGRLRAWMDQPKPMGLQPEAANLVVLAFAAQADRTPMRRGAPVAATLDRLDEQTELHAQPLPSEEAWARARARAGELFGLTASEVLKGATVAKLAEELRAKAGPARTAVTALDAELRRSMAQFGADEAGAPRLETLRSVSELLGTLLAREDAKEVVEALADGPLRTSEAAAARALGGAEALRGALDRLEWDTVVAASRLRGTRAAAAEGIRARMAEALEADEHATPLVDALRALQGRAVRLLSDAGDEGRTGSGTGAGPSGPVGAPGPPREGRPQPGQHHGQDRWDRRDWTAPGGTVVEEGAEASLRAAEAVALLRDLAQRVEAAEGSPGVRLRLAWTLTRQAPGPDAAPGSGQGTGPGDGSGSGQVGRDRPA